MTRHSHHQFPPALRWIALGCALLVWTLGLLGASPQLHGALHQDADHAGHTCAVTLFSHGVEDSLGSVEIVVAPVLFAAGETVALPAAAVANADVRLPPGCGPPRS